MSPLLQRPGSRWWASRDDRGSAELLFILPVALVMVLGVLHVGVWAHAQHRAQAVASQALSAARAFDGSVHLAHQRAEQAQGQLGQGVLRQVEVDITREADQARVRVRAQAVSLLPGTGFPVTAQVSGPVEHLAP